MGDYRMLTRVKGKGQIGARHVAWMRGVFNSQRLVVPGAGKPEAKASAVGATWTNVAQHRPAPAVATLSKQ